jgi:hypothetical protein
MLRALGIDFVSTLRAGDLDACRVNSFAVLGAVAESKSS